MTDRMFNGKTGEYVRWVVGLIVAGTVSYATAMGAIQREIAIIKATQEHHFSEILRRMDVMQQDIREIRNR